MNKFTEEDDALLAELGIKHEIKKKPVISAKEERIIAGFEEIQNFYREHDREPSNDHQKDIFERLYAIRLQQIRKQPDCIELLKDIDNQDLLDESKIALDEFQENISDDELIKELGLESSDEKSLTSLKHVKRRSEIKPAEQIGTRKPCSDFHIFKPLFDQVQADIKSGIRKVIPFRKEVSIERGNLFILQGQKAYVAEVGEPFRAPNDAMDARLRVIFDNTTESDQLMRSLKRRLHDDPNSRRITDLDNGPLFSSEPNDEDIATGIIYICRSQSDHHMVSENRDLVHKIGVTGRDFKDRVAGAEKDPTFLHAKADLVASYELFNIKRHKLENLLQKIFSSVRLNIEITDRWGDPYHPQEWFLVPLQTIDDAVNRIKDGSIVNYQFNRDTMRLERR